ncbi:hypothetical protein ACM1TL_05455 [Lysinibacillus capsici]
MRALEKAGCKKIYTEKVRGATTERPRLIQMLNDA